MTKALWIPALIAALAHSQAQSPSLVTPEVQAPRVQFRTFDSAAAKTKVSYHIYTPAIYEEDAGSHRQTETREKRCVNQTGPRPH